jgi:2-polyprenyl-3-methyl-5-hydroxy-6-metoxy-1,4-benzoquinol methylase
MQSEIEGKSQCALCGASETYLLLRKQDARSFYRCRACGGAFVLPRDFLSADEERARFSLHNNTIENSSYRAYLKKIADTALGHFEGSLAPPRSILDFGCGEHATLVELLHVCAKSRAAQAQIRIAGYDPLYPHAAAIPHERFDLVFCVETAEHFKEPRRSFETLASLCAPDGLLALATHLAPRDDKEFSAWWYKEDRAHYVFYSRPALVQLAHNAGFAFEKELMTHLYAFTKKG